MQGRIMHSTLEVDAVEELLKAHRMSPWRAEPLVYLAWQYARRMQVCLQSFSHRTPTYRLNKLSCVASE